MLLLGMISIDTAVSAQTPEQLRQLREKRGNAMLENIDKMGGCVDTDEWMTAEGYGESPKSPKIARDKARAAANQELIEKMEAYTERIAKGLSHMEINEATDDVYANALSSKFQQITQGMRGRIRECLVEPGDPNERGIHTCNYVAVVSLIDFNNALKESIAKDATLRAQTKMDEFDKAADEAWDAMATRRDSSNNQ